MRTDILPKWVHWWLCRPNGENIVKLQEFKSSYLGEVSLTKLYAVYELALRGASLIVCINRQEARR